MDRYDPYEYNTALLLHFDGANNSTYFVDDSSIPKVITPNGNAKISTDQSKFGGSSAYFDGTGDYLSVPSSSNLKFGTGDFTIEFSMRSGFLGSEYGSICGIWDGGSGQRSWEIYVSATGNIWFYWSTDGISYSYVIFPFSYNVDTWYNVAVTRSSGIMRCFIDGTQEGTNETVTANFYDASGAFAIGTSKPLTPGEFYKGYIDELRITKGFARYTENFTVQSAAFSDPTTRPVLQLAMDGSNNSTTFLDTSPYNRTVTAYGDAKISTTQSKFGDASGYFDGTGDYLSIPHSTDFNLGSGNFTMECWAYFTSYQQTPYAGTSYKIGLICKDNTSGREFVFLVEGSASSISNFTFGGFINDSSIQIVQGNYAFNLNQWYHLAACRYGSNVYLFVNGVQVNSTTSFTATIQAGTQPVTIGCDYYGGVFNPMQGYIDDVRITKGTALYRSDFTPPGTPFDTLYNNTLCLWGDGVNLSTNIIDSSYNPKTITITGNVSISSTVTHFSKNTIYFDGVGDYLTIPASSDFAFGTGDFTVEGWFYFIAFGSRITNRTSSGYSGTWSLGLYEYPTFSEAIVGEPGVVSSVAITLNQWTHIAATRFGTTLRIFINGVKTGETLNYSTNFSTSSYDLLIGRSSPTETEYFNGYIDDLRITKGAARYTENFTPIPYSYYVLGENLAPLFVTGEYTNADFTTIVFIRNDLFFNQVVLLLHFDGANNSTTFTDSSVFARTVTANGNAKISTDQSKFGGSSAYFDGTGDYLRITNSESFGFAENDYTIEAWIYPTAYPAGLDNPLFDFRSGEGQNGLFYLYPTSGLLTYYNGSIFGNTGSAPALNQWSHVAFVKSGISTKSYLNGVLQWTIGTFDFGTSRSLTIGGNFADSSCFSGYIDDIRITKGKARYTANFDVPVRAHPDSMFFNANLPACSLHLHCDGSNNSTTFIDSSFYRNVVTPVGNAKISTTQSKFGGSSAYFDGTGDYLSIPYSQNFNFGTGDFTIEMWVYLTSIYDWGGLFILGEWSAAGGIQFICGSSLKAYVAGTDTGNGYGTLTANTWTHIALTRRSGTVYIFRNGTLLTSVSAPGNVSNTSNIKIFAGDGSYGVGAQVGYMDELRVIKGTALYTANFTPLSIPFISGKIPLVSNLYYRGTLLSFYDCEQTSGALQDLMLNAPLSVTGTPSYDQTSIIDDYWAGKSITLDTADSFSGDFHSLSGMTTFTIHFYIKTSAVSQPIITKTGVFSIALNSSGQVVFSINSNSITSSQSINSNTMRQVTAVFDNGYLLLFIDGEMELFQLFPETTITDTNTEDLVIGGFDGTIDEIAFYSTAMKFFSSKNAYEAATNKTAVTHHNTDDMVYINPGFAPVELSYHIISEFGKAEEFDVQDGGNFYIEGIITIKGQPVSRKVCLCDRHSGRFIRVTWSDPDTGVYRFNKIKNEQFFIWSQDYEDQYNPVSSIPVVLPM